MENRTGQSLRECGSLTVAALVALMAPAAAPGLELRDPYAFADRFPGSAQHLGFEKGTRLAIGAYVDARPGDPTVTEATATQLVTGVQYSLEIIQLGFGPSIVQAIPMPALDVELHAGLWVIEVSDAEGNQKTTEAYLGLPLSVPFVEKVGASLDRPRSVIAVSWRPPKNQPTDCFLTLYSVRILRDFGQQLFKSDFVFEEFASVPMSVLPADWEGLWVRIENVCVALSGYARSNTFRPLLDLLAEP